jgi:hypothetical protein
VDKIPEEIAQEFADVLCDTIRVSETPECETEMRIEVGICHPYEDPHLEQKSSVFIAICPMQPDHDLKIDIEAARRVFTEFDECEALLRTSAKGKILVAPYISLVGSYDQWLVMAHIYLVPVDLDMLIPEDERDRVEKIESGLDPDYAVDIGDTRSMEDFEDEEDDEEDEENEENEG